MRLSLKSTAFSQLFFDLPPLSIAPGGTPPRLRIEGWSCMVSCMATKTISLEIDAYEKLKRANRGNESCSQVVSRARFSAEESTGARILEELGNLYRSNRGVAKTTLDYWDEAQKESEANPSISPSHWD